jgi:hypothetical protein
VVKAGFGGIGGLAAQTLCGAAGPDGVDGSGMGARTVQPAQGMGGGGVSVWRDDGSNALKWCDGEPFPIAFRLLFAES